MSITPFEFEGQSLRFVGEEVVATDLAKALGYGSAKDMTRTLDEDEKGGQIVPTLGGDQYLTTVTEAGFYRACLNRQAGYVKDPTARDFVKRLQRWVTSEVLPSIRKTGSYSATPQLSADEIVHQALQITAQRVEALTARLAIVEPKADAFDRWLSSNVDYSVGHVSNALSIAGVKDMGRNRLFAKLSELRWVFKADGQWTPYQTAIETGRLAVKLGSQLNTRTGEQFRTVTLRITPKGAAKLATLLGAMPETVADLLATSTQEDAA